MRKRNSTGFTTAMSIYSFYGRLFVEFDAIPITLDLFPSTMAWLKVFYHFVKPPKDVDNPKRLYCRCIGKR